MTAKERLAFVKQHFPHMPQYKIDIGPGRLSEGEAARELDRPEILVKRVMRPKY